MDLNYQIFWFKKYRKPNRWRRKYKGKVFCVTVPNSTIIVRDRIKKTAVVCGNCQDLVPEIIPVVQETMSRSMFKWSMYSGTPKTSTTTLAKLWRSSTKNE
jgi:hypothetical protein